MFGSSVVVLRMDPVRNEEVRRTAGIERGLSSIEIVRACGKNR